LSHGRLLGQLRVLDLNIRKFLDTLLEVRRVKTVIEQFGVDSRSDVIPPEARAQTETNFAELTMATNFVGAEVSAMAADRMRLRLADQQSVVTLGDVRDAIDDVERRLFDECQLISFIVFSRQQRKLFGPPSQLINWDIESSFPGAGWELEEACKCLALQRSTASVFHSMLFLEIGIKRLCKLLDIDEPQKAGDRNWGSFLKKIKAKIEERHPNRLPGSEGSELEELYMHLDAVRVAWRNTVMHVEIKYTDSDANHIANCVIFFMQALAAKIDTSVAPPLAPALSG
jgi:hypothetical protein